MAGKTVWQEKKGKAAMPLLEDIAIEEASIGNAKIKVVGVGGGGGDAVEHMID